MSTAGLHMKVISTFCCGRVYFRKRSVTRYCKDPNRRFWPRAKTHCVKCGAELEWDVRIYRNLTPTQAWYRRHRDRMRAQGLTTEGKPRRRHERRPAKEAYALVLERNRLRKRRQAAQLASQGLTSRGTLRKHSLPGRPAHPVAISYLQFRETLPQIRASLDLSPSERCELSAVAY